MAYRKGHASRLGRDLKNRFGTAAYAAEELVAELSSAMLGAELGLPVTHLDSHASYIEHWLKLLKDDDRGRVRRTSTRPLTLGELTDFLLTAWDLFQVLEMNFDHDGSSLEDALAFFRGETAFYPDFDALLRSRVKAWWTQRQDEQSDADDRHDQGTEVTIPADLIRAYEATDYWVEAPAGKVVLKIGQPFIGIDGVPGLKRLGIVTAYNPFSRPLEAAQNAERHAQLVDAVEREGLEWFNASGADAKGEWPPEPSLAILDPTDAQLDRWMEVFGQNAIVVAEVGGMAVLRLHPRHPDNRALQTGEGVRKFLKAD